MRIERPTPDAYPVVYDDEGKVIDDPNKQTKAQEKAVQQKASGGGGS